MIDATHFTPIEDIDQLMHLYDQEVREYPSLPDQETLLLRARLIFEEAVEFVVAAGCQVVQEQKPDGSSAFRIHLDPNAEPDLIEMADAIGDEMVVTIGAAAALGVKIPSIWNEIQRSNMSKVWPDGIIHKREDGKVVKPDTYSPANIESILIQQVDDYLQNLPHEVAA